MLRITDSDLAQRIVGGGVLTLITVVSTTAVACGTPFAALGALGALYLSRRYAFLFIIVNWAINQAIGFMWLRYPHTPECYLGGASIALAAGVGTLAAMLVSVQLRALGTPIRSSGAFATAFVSYEAVLFLVTPASSVKYFAWPIVAYIFWVNAVAFVGLMFVKTAMTALVRSSPCQPPAMGRRT